MKKINTIASAYGWLLLTIVLSISTSLQLQAQRRNVSGSITSQTDGTPLPGVNVLIKGTTMGTVSDLDGLYSLQLEQEQATLIFSSVGYTPKEIEVSAQSQVNVIMQEDATQLGEVIVTGYGTQIKEYLTGNIASIAGKDIEDIPVTSFEQAMQGRASGVFVESNNGKLGQGIKIRVRGSSSVTASNQPLYVVDGIPVTSQSQSSDEAQTNPLADINFNDVASVEVLKDASASAIYGSRASNGVILITTKKGKSGKTNFSLDAYTGFSKPTHRKEFLSTAEYVELFTEATLNSPFGFDKAFAQEQFTIDAAGNTEAWMNPASKEYIDTDWQDEIFQTGSISQIDLSASGGSDKTRFYISGSYSNQNGIIKTNAFQRISSRVNLDHQATERLQIGVNFSLSRTLNDRLPNDNAFSTPLQSVGLPPLTPPIDPRTGEISGSYTLYYNPLLNFAHSSNVSTVLRNISSAHAVYALLPGLTFRSEIGADILTQREDIYYGRQTARNTNATAGLALNIWTQVFNYTTNNFLTFNKTLSKHSIGATLGMSFQESQRNATLLEGQQFPSDAYKQITSAADITAGSSRQSQFSFLSYFARANYKYADRYLLTVSGRVDGSSRFGKNNRYGFFPAASLGWIISQEGFLDNTPVSFLKLRASYGITGNAEVDDFAALGLYAGDAGYAGAAGQRPAQIGNPDLKWEQTRQTDIGVDYGLFKDRISGEVDIYAKNTHNLLLSVNVPGTTGFSTQLRNVGKLENKGVEVVINSQNIVRQFSWTTSINLSSNINKITELQGQIVEGGFINRAVEGYAIGVFFAPEYAGVDTQNGDALYYINTTGADGKVDRSTTNEYNLAQRVVIGNPNPDFFGGITNNFSYKGIDMSIFFQGVYGNDIYNGAGSFQSANGYFFDNQTKDQMSRWTPDNKITQVPQARLYQANGRAESSRYVSDGSYLRLKTLTLGYSLPTSITERIQVSRLRFYVTAQNLWTLTNYQGWDPEVNADHLAGNIGQGNDFYSAPQAKTIIIGINISF